MQKVVIMITICFIVSCKPLDLESSKLATVQEQEQEQNLERTRESLEDITDINTNYKTNDTSANQEQDIVEQEITSTPTVTTPQPTVTTPPPSTPQPTVTTPPPSTPQPTVTTPPPSTPQPTVTTPPPTIDPPEEETKTEFPGVENYLTLRGCSLTKCIDNDLGCAYSCRSVPDILNVSNCKIHSTAYASWCNIVANNGGNLATQYLSGSTLTLYTCHTSNPIIYSCTVSNNNPLKPIVLDPSEYITQLPTNPIKTVNDLYNYLGCIKSSKCINLGATSMCPAYCDGEKLYSAISCGVGLPWAYCNNNPFNSDSNVAIHVGTSGSVATSWISNITNSFDLITCIPNPSGYLADSEKKNCYVNNVAINKKPATFGILASYPGGECTQNVVNRFWNSANRSGPVTMYSCKNGNTSTAINAILQKVNCNFYANHGNPQSGSCINRESFGFSQNGYVSSNTQIGSNFQIVDCLHKRTYKYCKLK